jgi:hypothetical protein
MFRRVANLIGLSSRHSIVIHRLIRIASVFCGVVFLQRVIRHQIDRQHLQSFMAPISSILVILSLCIPAFALYDPSGPVPLLTPASFDKLIRNSNHASIVEFFAPWSVPAQQLIQVWPLQEACSRVYKSCRTHGWDFYFCGSRLRSA